MDEGGLTDYLTGLQKNCFLSYCTEPFSFVLWDNSYRHEGNGEVDDSGCNGGVVIRVNQEGIYAAMFKELGHDEIDDQYFFKGRELSLKDAYGDLCVNPSKIPKFMGVYTPIGEWLLRLSSMYALISTTNIDDIEKLGKKDPRWTFKEHDFDNSRFNGENIYHETPKLLTPENIHHDFEEHMILLIKKRIARKVMEIVSLEEKLKQIISGQN